MRTTKIEKKFLEKLTKTGRNNAKEFERAYVLLALDKGKSHEEIGGFLDVSRVTTWRIKKKYNEFGKTISVVSFLFLMPVLSYFP